MRNRGHSRTPDPLHHTWTRYSEPGPSHPHVDPLFRAWAIPPTCGTGGLHAGQRVYARNRGHSRTPDPLHHTRTRYSEPGPSHPHVNPLFQAWASSSAREPAIPSLGNPAHMQNSGLTCGTGGLPAEQQRAVPHGAARLACLRAAHRHCGTVRQRRRSAAESPGVMSLARATRSAAGSA